MPFSLHKSLKYLLSALAAAVILIVVIAQFYDWQVLMVKTGVRFLSSPSAHDPALNQQSIDSDTSYSLDIILDGLELPWAITLLTPDQALVTERAGKLYRVSLANGDKTEILGIPQVHYKGQGGLFDAAVHPDFPNTPWVYFSYAVAMPDNMSTTRLARAKISPDKNKLDEWQILYTSMPALETNRHYGGRLLFYNNYLYMTMGERGHREFAQKLDNDLGKTLRFNIDGSVAEHNPFANIDKASKAIYSYGHRNAQGLALRPGTDELWVSEHGPQGGDEINLLKPGANYGWPTITYGEEYGGGKIGEGTSKPGLEQPLHYYLPSIATGNLAFYHGNAFPNWRGDIFVTGLRSFDLSRLAIHDTGNGLLVEQDERLLGDIQLRLRDIKIADNGYLYLLSENGSIAVIKPPQH